MMPRLTKSSQNCYGPHTRFTEFKVPSENLLAPPEAGAALIKSSFGMSAALVSAMGVCW